MDVTFAYLRRNNISGLHLIKGKATLWDVANLINPLVSSKRVTGP